MAVVTSRNGAQTFNNSPVKKRFISRIRWKLNNADFAGTLPNYTVVGNLYPNSSGTQAGDTGGCYNFDFKVAAVAVYNFADSAHIWEYKNSTLAAYANLGPTPAVYPTPDLSIDLTSYMDHIQGIAWSRNMKCYLAWGTIKGQALADPNRILVFVDRAGNLVRQPWYPDFQTQPGMVAIRGDILYFKSNTEFTLRMYDIKSMSFISSTDVYTNSGEGVAVDPNDGSIWISSDDGTVHKYDQYINFLYSFNTSIPTGENEGIIIFPNGVIGICADTRIHGSISNGNRLYLFDPDKTKNKFVSFPDMYFYSQGTFSNGAQATGSLIQNTGIWESPVIDVGSVTDYLTNSPFVEGNGFVVSFEFRFSATAPTTTAYTEMDYPTYSGWGTTTPSAYSGTVAAGRYQQIRVTIKSI